MRAVPLLACLILAIGLLSCAAATEPNGDGQEISWGHEKDGIVCGVAAGQAVRLGEQVEISVFLRNSRLDEVECNVSTIGSYRLAAGGLRRMYLVVDATGTQYTKGQRHVIPPGQSGRILVQRFATRPAGNHMSDIHFTPGSMPIVVVCTPLFQHKRGPLLAGDVSGLQSGVAEVTVLDPTGE